MKILILLGLAAASLFGQRGPFVPNELTPVQTQIISDDSMYVGRTCNNFTVVYQNYINQHLISCVAPYVGAQGVLTVTSSGTPGLQPLPSAGIVANAGGTTTTTIASSSDVIGALSPALNQPNGLPRLDSSAHVPPSQLNFLQSGTGAVNRTVQDKNAERVTVTDYGCFKDGVTDDSPCFIRAITYIESARRAAPGGGNLLGSVKLYVPAGTYMVKAPLLTTAFTLRTVGLIVEGDGPGVSTIVYQPTASAPLFTNNDAFLFVRMIHLSFQMNDAGSDFMDSVSSGGAQNYDFEDVGWSGAYRYGFNLTGSNSNSEMLWNKCSISGTNASGTFFYIGPTGTSDQFLNYVFTNNSIDLSAGNFIDASKGGHFKILNNDFSGLNGSGNPSAPNILFALRGTAHAFGVQYFLASGNRFELESNSVSVLYSEWSGGQVTFQDNDFSSQVQGYLAATVAFEVNLTQAAAQYSFFRNHLIGSVKIDTNNSNWGYRENVTFEDAAFMSFEDYSQAFIWNVAAGSNYGGLPVVQCVRCRGNDSIPSSATYPAWASGATYAANATVSSGGYSYVTASGGVSGSTAPTGRSASISDGGVTWATVDTYPGSSYATEALIRYSGANSLYQNGLSSQIKTAAISDPFNYGKLPSSASLSGGFSIVILPPNALIYRIQFVAVPSGNTQTTAATFTARTNNYSPFTFFSTTFPNYSNGGSYDYVPPIPYSVGTDIGSRSIVLYPSANVAQVSSGYFLVWYL